MGLGNVVVALGFDALLASSLSGLGGAAIEFSGIDK